MWHAATKLDEETKVRMLVVHRTGDDRWNGSFLRNSLLRVCRRFDELVPEDVVDASTSGVRLVRADAVFAPEDLRTAVKVAAANNIALLVPPRDLAESVSPDARTRAPTPVALPGVRIDNLGLEPVLDHLVCRPSDGTPLRITTSRGRSSVAQEVVVDTGDPLGLRTRLSMSATAPTSWSVPVSVRGDADGCIRVHVDQHNPIDARAAAIQPGAFRFRLLRHT